MEEKKIVTVVNVPLIDFHEDYVCSCGNDSYTKGFFPCLSDGGRLDLEEGDYEGHYKCMKCGIVIMPIED